MKTKEEIIEQRKQLPIVLVSDNGVTWVRRILLLENIGGSCVVVHSYYEEDFLSGKPADLQRYNYYKPIQAPTYKPFENPTIELLKNEVACRFIGETATQEYRILMNCYGVEFYDNFYEWEYAFQKLELSYDNGNTWQPFGEICD